MMLLDSFPLPADPEVDPDDPPGAFLWASADGISQRAYPVPFFPNGAEVIDRSGRIWSSPPGDPSTRITHFEPGGDTIFVLHTLQMPLA